MTEPASSTATATPVDITLSLPTLIKTTEPSASASSSRLESIPKKNSLLETSSPSAAKTESTQKYPKEIIIPTAISMSKYWMEPDSPSSEVCYMTEEHVLGTDPRY